MLYLTTRSRTDSFTANRALHEALAPDGGFYLPYRFPVLSAEDIAELSSRSFSGAVALLLNRFFPVKLTAWDVEFCAGKNIISSFRFGRKICCIRAWNNIYNAMDQLEGRIYALLRNEIYVGHLPSGWARVAIRISLLFGFCAELMSAGICEFDIALHDKDFDMVVASWYARAMGLPIGTILVGCGNNGGLWDLIHKGEASTQQLNKYPGLEMLIYSTLGLHENLKYLQTKGIYKLDPLRLPQLNTGIFASVVGQNRVSSLIQGVMRTDGLLIDPAMASCCGALQDYRAKAGESKVTLILSTAAPLCSKEEIIQATGITESEFKKLTQ